jgi:hypothetical protein
VKPTPPGVTLRGDRNCCTGCGELFNSSYAFGKHRTGDHTGNQRRCMTVPEMEKLGMIKNDAGFWITEARHG